MDQKRIKINHIFNDNFINVEFAKNQPFINVDCLPSKDELDELIIGTHIKICNDQKYFWIEIKEINNDSIIGQIIDNNNVLPTLYKNNDLIHCKKHNIINIHTKQYKEIMGELINIYLNYNNKLLILHCISALCPLISNNTYNRIVYDLKSLKII
jgi:hypothetical protein